MTDVLDTPLVQQSDAPAAHEEHHGHDEHHGPSGILNWL